MDSRADEPALGTFGGGFVLLSDAGRNASAVADRDIRLFGLRRIPPLQPRLAVGHPLIGIMPVILVKLIMACFGSGAPRWWRWC